jgi:hypothetical protein
MNDERKIQEEIDRIFGEANLPEDDRSLWRERLFSAGFRFPAVFVETFSGDSDLLRFFTGNLRKRLLAGNDRSKLDAVLAEEEAYFSGLLIQTRKEV